MGAAMLNNNTKTFAITVRRIVREDIVIMIDAENEEQAKQQAMNQAPNEQEWIALIVNILLTKRLHHAKQSRIYKP